MKIKKEKCDECGKLDYCYHRALKYCRECYKEKGLFWIDILPFGLLLLLVLVLIL